MPAVKNITLQFPNFTSMKHMVERCSLQVTGFDTMNYTISGNFTPEVLAMALGQLGAQVFASDHYAGVRFN
ncbi:hypothetical protein [Flaviaesturariibacter amylovorans]|uniref:HMA domain-containing protein n=1 Tax=Flaviaesturariibacter amylovorans TaxID=1084520 RepID=A0ABP8HNN3_9BACT